MKETLIAKVWATYLNRAQVAEGVTITAEDVRVMLRLAAVLDVPQRVQFPVIGGGG